MAILGRLHSVEISTNGGTTWTKVGYLTGGTWNGSLDEIETTNHDSGSSKEYVPGRDEHTLDFTARYDESDPGQVALEDAYFNKTVAKFRWRAKTGAGSKQRVADGFVTTLNVDTPDDGVDELSVTVRLTGSITRSTQ